MSLILDDIINEYETEIEILGKKFKINCDFKSVLKYEKLLKKVKDPEILGAELLKIIFGEKLEEFNNLIKNNAKSTKHMNEIWSKVISYWMSECGFEIKDGNEVEKK